MDQFEYQRKKQGISLKKLAAFVLCICMFLSSVEMEALAAGIQEAADVLSEEFVDNVGYAFVTPDIITPDEDYGYGATGLRESTYDNLWK